MRSPIPRTSSGSCSTPRCPLPPGSTGPFGSWALQNGNAFVCVDWPAPVGGAALAAGPLPDVPVLVLSGDRDIRTPTANAVAIAARADSALLS